MIRLTPQKIELEAAAGDQPRRTFIGIAAPYGVAATTMDGTKVQFAEGSLPTDGPAPKLLEYHDQNRPVGIVMERVSIPGVGMSFAAKISDTTAGRDALTLIKDGVLTEVSVGVEPLEFAWEGDTMVVSKAAWNELSLVTAGAFGAQAKIDTVYAQAQTDEPAPAQAAAEETPTPEGEPEMETPEVIEAATEQTNPILFAQPRRVVPMPTAAEYLAAAVAGGDQWKAMSETIRAAAPDVVTTDTPGILPTPIVSPTYNNFLPGLRPVVDAIGAKAMPGGGKVFIRPEVTTHTSIGASISEQSPTAGTFVVFNNQVTKQIFGGYVNVSEADMDWSDPNVMQLVLDDMARIYANATDNYAADQLRSGASVTQNFTGVDTDDPAAWAAWIGTAAKTILSSSNGNLPTHLFVDPEVWAVLLALSDTAKRPLFPNVGAMNAFGGLQVSDRGGDAFGLQVVVDRNFASDTLIIGCAGGPTGSGYEIFEQQKGAISIDSPSTLSRTVAWRGYFATLMIDPTKFVRAVFV